MYGLYGKTAHQIFTIFWESAKFGWPPTKEDSATQSMETTRDL